MKATSEEFRNIRAQQRQQTVKRGFLLAERPKQQQKMPGQETRPSVSCGACGTVPRTEPGAGSGVRELSPQWLAGARVSLGPPASVPPDTQTPAMACGLGSPPPSLLKSVWDAPSQPAVPARPSSPAPMPPLRTGVPGPEAGQEGIRCICPGQDRPTARGLSVWVATLSWGLGLPIPGCRAPLPHPSLTLLAWFPLYPGFVLPEPSESWSCVTIWCFIPSLLA